MTWMQVRELLSNFEADARLLLLFLRNVERISVYERDARAAGNSKTRDVTNSLVSVNI